MLNALYDIVVQPLAYLIELVFSLGWRLTDNAGAAILGVSLAVNLLCLPLYRMADAAQEAERGRQAGMKRWVDHINVRFSGDERVMMTQAYYRLRHYRPAQALVGSLSLLLQIPFFMAAYSYLSGLSLLKGASFLFLTDLGAPDELLALGGLHANLMPILMTALNCASTAVYTRGLPLRDKLQAYGLAAVFLVVLYDSPSGLVLYWTCNQLFSLGKNAFMRALPNPEHWLRALAQVFVLGISGALVAMGKVRTPWRALVLAVGLLAFEALWLQGSKRSKWVTSRESDSPDERRQSTRLFFAGGALLTILLGILIPSALIGDSPTEFMTGTTSPLGYVLHTTCVWGGVFLLWWGTYFVLSNDASRKRHVLTMWLLCGVCLLNYFAFGRDLGTITTRLTFDGGVRYSRSEIYSNLLVLAVLTTALYVVWCRWHGFLLPVTCVVAVALATMAAINVSSIAVAVSNEKAVREETANSLIQTDGTPRRIFHLSQTEKNVVVIFLDRAISGFLPYIMAERPELEAQFDGFTYYPNALSYGGHTNFGAPPLYGGYEYTPAAMNARSGEPLLEKHDEALLLMPTLMSGAGFITTVTDPPYAGTYEWEPDLSLFDGLENTETVITSGTYTELVQERLAIDSGSAFNRSFVLYSLFKVVPEVLQRRVYDSGNYLSPDVRTHPKRKLVDELSVLELLPDLTDSQSSSGGFVLLCNNTTHEHDYLQLPDYEIAEVVSNEGLEDFSRFELNGRTIATDTDTLTHYHVNAAALIRLGRWFDWLREQGVWDNTRVVIVADHGYHLDSFDDLILNHDIDLMKFNPLLMVKDFGATGFTTSMEFMTNADVPTLAMSGVVSNPVNPFTGNVVTDEAKNDHYQLVTLSTQWDTSINNGTTFLTSDKPWYSVHDNIFDLNNWTRYATYEEAIEAVPQ